MNDISTSETTGRGPGMANLVIIALSAIAIVVGVVALVAGFNARKSIDELKKDLEAQTAAAATTEQNLRNLTSQIQNLVGSLNQRFAMIDERVNTMAGKIATLTAPPKPPAPVAGLAPAGAAPVAGAQQPTPTAGAAAVAAAPAAPSGKTYKIESGDNFGKIAKKMNIAVSALEKANPDVNPAKLKIGQAIKLP